MSSGVGADGERAEVAGLRAMAHPLRLRMMSLLTGAAMSAAEVARELGTTHANASYHLRQLHAAGLLEVAEEESIRGGKARRYRYDVDSSLSTSHGTEDSALYYQALANELVRRAAFRRDGGRATSSDAELWVPDDVWADVLARVLDAVTDLHRAAQPPRTPDTVHVSVTTALFELKETP